MPLGRSRRHILDTRRVKLRQLRHRRAGLISGERRGTWVYYRVRPEVIARLSTVLMTEREQVDSFR
jgi:DNA-binding transcriptional ArsR family regulator